jgi:hypothetical protein
MPYKKSRSRIEFEDRISTLKSYIVTSNETGIDYVLKQCVYRNCIFQCSAALEEYIRQIFTDWIDHLIINNMPTKNVPPELVMLSFGNIQIQHFKTFIINQDELEFVNGLTNTRDLDKHLDSNSSVKDFLRHKKFIDDKKYPSKENLIKIFKRFGIKNYFDKINQIGSKDYALHLKSLSDRRTSIAHEYPTPNITDIDTISTLDDISDLVNSTDRVLYSQVCTVSGQDTWNGISP